MAHHQFTNATYIVNTNPPTFIHQPQHIPQHHQIHPQHHHPAPSHHHGRHGEKPLVRGKTSPYGFFVKMCYEEHKKKYPNENVQVTEISKKCSQKWKTMTDEEKKRFFELAQKDAERYQAEVAAYGGDDGRKRKRAKKDPNAPKRALSAFFFFSNEKRNEIQQSHPEWKVGQIAQELGRFWKSLTDIEKQVYEKKAANDKERYADEMRTYRTATGKPQPPQPSSFRQQPQQVQMAQQSHPQVPQQQAQMVILQQPGGGQLPMQILDDHVSMNPM